MSDLADHAAERQLLAIALHAGPIDAFLAVPPTAYNAWTHQAIATAIHRLHRDGKPTDPPPVMREAVTAAGGDTKAKLLGKLVTDLTTHLVPAAGAGYYAERITALAAARDAVTSAQRFVQQITQAAEHDDDDQFTRAAASFREAIDRAETTLKPAPPELPMSLAELLAQPDEEFNWLIPDLLERMDRLILTGFEGHGKSYLLAQFACSVAAGLHPFTSDPLPDIGRPYRVLVFDVENTRRQMRRRYRAIRYRLDRRLAELGLDPVAWPERQWIISRPEGVPISEPRELARIEQNIAAVQPDLVLAGPIYKLSREDIKEDHGALALIAVLDQLRVRHQFTLILEHHSGHLADQGGRRKVRPFGSSVWLRWPEFGIGIAPHPDHDNEVPPSRVNVVHWRGPRDERRWPTQLRHGRNLPWEPANDDYWDQPTRLEVVQ